MAIRSKWSCAVAALAVGAFSLAGCSSEGGEASNGSESLATGSPIEVAAIITQSLFPEASQAAQAVFDDYNTSGGFGGRPIELTVYDDKSDAATSATATQQVVSSAAVALVGSSSAIDCEVNHETWEQNGLVSIEGIGTDPYCFTTSNVAPVNTGPYFGTFASLYYGSETLGYQNICAMTVGASPATRDATDQAIAAWTEATGEELSYIDDTLTYGQQSYAANISALKGQECDAIFSSDIAADLLGILGESTNQGLTLPVLALTSVFSDEFAQSAGYSAPIYLPAEFAPYFDDSIDGVSDWQEVMDAHGVPKTSFAQGGYLAAHYFIDILESIDGEVTRESFTNAAQGMTETLDYAMAQAPYIFGDGDSHQPNNTAYRVVLNAGSTEWEAVGPLLDGSESGWIPTAARG